MIIEMIQASRNIANARAGQILLCYLLTGQHQTPDPGQVIQKLCSTLPDSRIRQRVGHVFTSWQEGDDLSWFDLPGCLEQMQDDDQQARDSRIVERSKRLHFSIALSPQDRRLDRLGLSALLSDTLEGMGLQGHTYLAVEHTDTDHPHLHVYVSTVDTKRHRLSRGHKDPHAVRALCRTLEDKYGFTPTGRAKAAAAEQKREQAAGLQARLQEQLSNFKNCRSWAELMAVLAGQDLQLHHTRRAGLCITDKEGHTVRTSKLDGQLTFSHLKKLWGDPPDALTATAQPAPRQEPPQNTQARLELEGRYKNAALRRLLSAAAAGTLVTGSQAVQARAAREAAKLGITGLRFEHESVAAAYEFMIKSHTVLRTSAISGFAIPQQEPYTAEKPREMPRPEVRLPAPPAPGFSEPWPVYYLKTRGYAITEGSDDQEMQAVKDSHQLHIAPDCSSITLTDRNDETAIADALYALHAGDPRSVLELSGPKEFQRRAAALAAALQIAVKVSDPDLARELSERPEPPAESRPARSAYVRTVTAEQRAQLRREAQLRRRQWEEAAQARQAEQQSKTPQRQGRGRGGR